MSSYGNLWELFEARALNTKPQLHFLAADGKPASYSYSEIYKMALATASALRRKNLPFGGIVGIFLPTSPEYIAAFFGVQLAGGVPFAVSPPRALAEVGDWKEKFKEQYGSVGGHFVIVDSKSKALIDTSIATQSISELMQLSESSQKESNSKIHNLAFLQFSSGTTGVAKAIAISHTNILANAQSILDAFPKSGSIHNNRACCVTWLPLYHDMGLVGGLISSILANCQLVLIRPEYFIANPYLWLKAISDFKATITISPNFAFGLCTRRVSEDALGTLDLSSLEAALCGAEMIHPQTMNEFIRTFSKAGFQASVLTPVYGLAEATLAVAFSQVGSGISWKRFDPKSLSENSLVRTSETGVMLSSVGKPLSNVQIEIKDEAGQAVPNGRVGTIWTRGPSVMVGYYQNPEESKTAIKNNWLNTGDLGVILEGNLFITGRKKEIVIIRGQNFDPSLIERPLVDIAELRKGCYVAFSSSLKGTSDDAEALYIMAEMPKGSVYSEKRKQLVKENVLKLIGESVGIRPDRVLLLRAGSLPRTTSGKIRRAIAKNMWERDELVEPVSLFKFVKAAAWLIKCKLRREYESKF